ncbi:MAG: flagellar biosynthetic protein FliQ [Rhodospirillales bacterium]|nr:flagellar biosynthetic protein FliQ [Rhodospirillales bacterium]
MDAQEIGALLHQAAVVVLKLGGPPLLAGLLAGVIMSLLQAVTQIHEQAVAFVPKMVAVVAVLLLLGSMMMATLSDFTRMVFDRLIAVGAQ